MKYINLVVLALVSAPAFASASFYCEAVCENMEFHGTYCAPNYAGNTLQGEGATPVEAMADLQAKCQTFDAKECSNYHFRLVSVQATYVNATLENSCQHY